MTDPRIFQTTYDRAACETGVVHIGFGAFHRAHQAVYFDDYMQATGDLRWGIAAVNLRATEAASFARSARTDRGYLLKSIAPDGAEEFREIRSHNGFFDATDDLDAAVDLLSMPSVQTVTITVTESGYSFKEDWSLDLAAPAIQQDLTSGSATTLYGYLTQALERRAHALDAPISVLCCDNIRSNGRVLEHALLAFIRAANKPDLAAWVEAKASFPCSMVDRITPRTTPALEAEVAKMFPNHATAPIHAEDFTQWVLEDNFAAPMPDLARAGVQIVADVDPYEEAKIRILNGGHTGLTYLGALAGHDTFDQAMRDATLRAHFDAFETNEVLPGLGTRIPFNVQTYLAQVAARFENAGIADQLERICMDGYAKMPIYIRPTLRACLSAGVTPHAGYASVASWVVYARQAQDGVARIPYHEPFMDKLAPMLARGHEADLAQDPQMWGDLPTRYPTFVPDLVAAIKEMDNTWQA